MIVPIFSEISDQFDSNLKESKEKVDEHLEELAFLALTAGANTKRQFTQKLSHPDNVTFVGKGKLEELTTYVEAHQIDLVIFDDDLTGKQQNTLEKNLKCKIVDRSTLILDIFASRAQTAQAKAQEMESVGKVVKDLSAAAPQEGAWVN